jgi:hypothetical protein
MQFDSIKYPEVWNNLFIIKFICGAHFVFQLAVTDRVFLHGADSDIILVLSQFTVMVSNTFFY